MPYQPIENYGIGDLRTAALVGLDGSIDWLCLPRFDSPSVFGAILDDTKGGRFRIAPAANTLRRKQFYWPDTNVLVTRFLRPDAGERTTSCRSADRGRPRRPAHPPGAVSRGRLPFRWNADRHSTTRAPRTRPSGSTTEPSSTAPRVSRTGDAAAGRTAAARSASSPSRKARAPRSSCTSLPADQPRLHLPGGGRGRFRETVDYWQRWLGKCTYAGRWREMVRRSALALKLLTYEPTGAIVAAPTTSLPEGIGGVRNWDYRYTWIRDAAFTSTDSCGWGSSRRPTASGLDAGVGRGGGHPVEAHVRHRRPNELTEELSSTSTDTWARARCGLGTAPTNSCSWTSTASCWTPSTCSTSTATPSAWRPGGEPADRLLGGANWQRQD